MRVETVREAFEPLIRCGFSELEASFEGTDFTVTFRRGAEEVGVFAEDMGSNIPAAFVRRPDRGLVDFNLSSDYPAHSAVRKARWPRSLLLRRRLRSVLQREVDHHVERLAAAVIAELALPNQHPGL